MSARVNFARVKILHESKKICYQKLIKITNNYFINNSRTGLGVTVIVKKAVIIINE